MTLIRLEFWSRYCIPPFGYGFSVYEYHVKIYQGGELIMVI